jgi:hypothetical protein
MLRKQLFYSLLIGCMACCGTVAAQVKRPSQATPAKTPVKPAETKPVTAAKTSTKPAETKPVTAAKTPAKPAETKPVTAAKTPAKPAETKPAEPKKEEAKPVVLKRPESKTTVVDFSPGGKITVTKNAVTGKDTRRQAGAIAQTADADNAATDNETVADTDSTSQTSAEVTNTSEPKNKSEKPTDEAGFQASKEQIEAAKKDIESDYSGYKNCVWIDAFSAIGGFPSLSYERVLNKKVTVAVGGGVTFGGLFDNPIHGFLVNNLAPYLRAENDAYWAEKGFVNDPDKSNFLLSRHDGGVVPLGNIREDLGTYLFAEAKYYTDDVPFQGSYAAIRFNYMRFNYVYGKNGIAKKLDIYKTYLDLIPCIGFQRSRDRLVFDYELGLGARVATAHAINTAQKVVGGGVIGSSRVVDQTAIIPVLLLAFKIGYAF